MHKLARHILAACLTIALIVGGVPFAHAMPASSPAVAAVQEAGTHRLDAGHAMHHQMQHEASADNEGGVMPAAPGNSGDLCKGLKCCSMCATAYVAPVLRGLNVERLSFAVRYETLTAIHREAVTFIDPGIPIA